ncbi:MAG: hypothetical protein ACPHWZ_09940, partial [Longimicrobiales bacterium]
GEAHRSLEAAVGAVADALTSHGFAARSVGTANELRIVSEHCPFGQAAVDRRPAPHLRDSGSRGDRAGTG